MSRKERRESTQALKRAEAKGCACCGKPLSRFMPALVVLTATGRTTVQHTTCPMPLGSVCSSIVSAEICAKNPDIEEDRIWFEAHPGAEYRFRKALPEEWARWRLSNAHGALSAGMKPAELPDIDADHQYMAVRQLEPGKRARLPVGVPDGVAFPDAAAMASMFAASFGDKQGYSFDAAAIAVSVAAKVFGISDHDMLDLASAEGESLSAVKH